MHMLINSRLAALCGVLALACGRTPSAQRPVLSATSPVAVEPPQDPTVVYHQMGLIATSTPLPFVGKIGYFAGSTPDTTILLTSISISNRALSFVREGDTYRAPYEIHLTLTKEGKEVDAVHVMELVRVATFKEINRTDESVIFQHFFRIPPGNYNILFQVRDVGSARSAEEGGAITVPRIMAGQLSTPVLVYEARVRPALDSIPRLLASPRSSAVFGQDSAISVYLEGYGQGAQLPVSFVVQNDRGVVASRDMIVLQRRGNLLGGAVSIPVSRVGIGIANVTFTRSDATDTVRTPIFISFGDGIPLLSYEEMLSQLRYYAAPDRIRTLRDATPERRGTVWGEFLRASDPSPSTPEHEGLQAYFARVAQSNMRFKEENTRTGWLSDRGKVFVALGEPDQIFEQSTSGPLSSQSITQRGRVQYWEYNQYRMRLVFYDETGLGRWRLTPASETEFLNANARIMVH
jgi:GWxTD domain-containing protein